MVNKQIRDQAFNQLMVEIEDYVIWGLKERAATFWNLVWERLGHISSRISLEINQEVQVGSISINQRRNVRNQIKDSFTLNEEIPTQVKDEVLLHVVLGFEEKVWEQTRREGMYHISDEINKG